MTSEEHELFEGIIHALESSHEMAGHRTVGYLELEDCRAKLRAASRCPATVTETPVGEKCNYSFNQTPLAHRTCTLPKFHEGPCMWGSWTENP